MEKKKLTVYVVGEINSGKSRIVHLISKFLKSKINNVIVEPTDDFPDDKIREEMLDPTLELVIESLRDTAQIIVKELTVSKKPVLPERDLCHWCSYYKFQDIKSSDAGDRIMRFSSCTNRHYNSITEDGRPRVTACQDFLASAHAQRSIEKYDNFIK